MHILIAPKGGGTVFPVGKPGRDAQRLVWHGSRVSAAAVPPPKPRFLASPTALLSLEASVKSPILVSKRDASCWFDQLKLPESIRAWMGHPCLTVAELCSWEGFCRKDLESLLQAGECLCDDRPVYILSNCWPMGFAWSSYVAQASMLGLCARAGIPSSQLLSVGQTTPDDLTMTAALATDDLMVFKRADAIVSVDWCANFDKAMDDAGAQRNAAKDVTWATDATVVGVNVEKGLALAAPPGRCISLFVSVLQLTSAALVTPRQVLEILGVLQWFDLLCHRKLSVYNAIYAFTRTEPATTELVLPPAVRDELFMPLCSGIYWYTPLDKPWASWVGATDASSSFGFGASVLKVSPDEVRRIAKVAEKQGDYVVLDSGCNFDNLPPRLGNPHRLDLAQHEFSHVFSIKIKRHHHNNILEGEAFVTFLRWVVRARKNRFHRIVVLVDSSAWAGAAAKGRSSFSLLRICRRMAAIELSAELQVHVVLVPSAENPSGEPSRGARRKKPPPSLPVLSWKDIADSLVLGGWEFSDRFWDESRQRCTFDDLDHSTTTGPSVDSLEPHDLGAEDASSLGSLTTPRGIARDASFSFSGAGDASPFGSLTTPRQVALDASFSSAVDQGSWRSYVANRASTVQSALPGAPLLSSAQRGAGSNLSKMWRPRALDLFSGGGNWATVATADGWRADSVDILHGIDSDLLLGCVQDKYLERIAGGCYQYVHCGPPCSSFSVARCPPVRTREHPWGKPLLPSKDVTRCTVGNKLALFSLRVLQMCHRLGIAASLEQPASSWLFKLPPFVDFIDLFGVHMVKLEFSAYGTSWRKRTKLLTVHVDLSGLGRLADQGTVHQVLRGRAPSGKSWTLTAQPYPIELCKAWVRLLRCLN